MTAAVQIANRGEGGGCVGSDIGPIGRCDGVGQLVVVAGAPMMIERPAPRDRANPAAERGRLAQLAHARPGVDEHVLDEVVRVLRWHTRDQHAMHGARETLIQLAERAPVVGAGLDDELYVAAVRRQGSHTVERTRLLAPALTSPGNLWDGPPTYSARNATTGSIRVARRAGR